MPDPARPDAIARHVAYAQAAFPVLQNRLYDTPEDARRCQTGDIEIAEDPQTGLVSNVAFKPDLVVYDRHYNNEQGLSGRFQAHLKEVAAIVGHRLGCKDLVEVGCGKGLFLEMLVAAGFDIAGCDPTYEGHNERIVPAHFKPGVMKPASGIILRHVLEHVPHPYDFLVKIAAANNNAGRIYIEVPCLDWILDRRAWFDIFYEHVNYFRLDDFHRMFARVIESGRLFDGQYLYVVAELDSLRPPLRLPSAPALKFPHDFLASLAELPKDSGLVLWGAASKGVIFALLCARLGRHVRCVVDINPAKQKKYFPVTAVPVMGPDEAMRSIPAGTTIYVMNSNYLGEVAQLTQGRYRLVAVDHG